MHYIFSLLRSERVRAMEQKAAWLLLFYLSGLAGAYALEGTVKELGYHPLAAWLLLTFLGFYLFAGSGMAGAHAAVPLSWVITAILMATTLPVWMIFFIGVLSLFLIDSLSVKPKIFSEDMPPTSAKPIPKEEFFNLAEDGMKLGKFIVGKDILTNGPIWISQESLVEHMQTVGITRCGKSHLQNAIAYQGMIRKWTVIYITGKPSAIDFDIYWYLANRSGRGGEVLYFDPLDDKRSDSLNPIAAVSQYGTELEIAHQIMRAIGREPPAAQERSDAFYKGADFSRVLDFASILVPLDRCFTLKDCYLFFSDNLAREYVFREAEKTKNPDIVRIVARMRQMFENLNGKKYDSLEAITSQLRPWIAEPVSSKVNDPNPVINIADLLRNGGLLYCALSPARLQSQANALGRQIIAQIFAASEMLGSQHLERPPVLLVLDEFQEYLAPFFNSMISQAGGRQVCIILAHQDFMQLQRIEGIDKRAFSANIVNNTATKIFFSTRAVDDAETMSKLIGTKRVIERSRTISLDPKGGSSFRSISERQGEEYRVHPNWFKTPKKFLAAFSSRNGNHVLRTFLFNIKGIRLSERTLANKPAGQKPVLDLSGIESEGINREMADETKRQRKRKQEKAGQAWKKAVDSGEEEPPKTDDKSGSEKFLED